MARKSKGVLKEKRLFSRFACGLEVELRRVDRKEQLPATCRDLSLSGVGLEATPAELERDELVELCLEGFSSVVARVCWSEAYGAGLRLEGSILDIVDTWVGEILAAHGVRVSDLTQGF